LDEIGHCLKLEPDGKQSIHVAAMRRIGQHIEHLAMCLDKALVSRLRGHFDSRHGVDGLPARRGEAVAESFVSDCRIPNAGKSFPPEFGHFWRGKRLAPPSDRHTAGSMALSIARPRIVSASRSDG